MGLRAGLQSVIFATALRGAFSDPLKIFPVAQNSGVLKICEMKAYKGVILGLAI
jgi:hypothetical protein